MKPLCVLLFIICFGVFPACRKDNYTQEWQYKSAPKHKISYGFIKMANLTPDDVHYFATKEFDKNPWYDSVYVNVIPALSDPRPIYTVIDSQLVMFHFCSRKMSPSSQVSIEYDSCEQNTEHMFGN